MKLGLISDSLRLDFPQSIAKAAELGVSGVQKYLTGGVDWDKYIAALNDIGYTGYLTVEREVGADPAADIVMAVDFLREKLAAQNICIEK